MNTTAANNFKIKSIYIIYVIKTNVEKKFDKSFQR